jgi:hypothetical protein
MNATETKTSNRHVDTPRDKPITERAEHANLERRPGAQAHPRAAFMARGWEHYLKPAPAWRMA